MCHMLSFFIYSVTAGGYTKKLNVCEIKYYSNGKSTFIISTDVISEHNCNAILGSSDGNIDET